MDIQSGQTLQHYRLIEKIGEGGMGVVWKAQDTRLHRHVALKFVPAEAAGNPQHVDRHIREARAASAMNHPHICSIHDIGEQEGRRFIVMELLEGQSLRQHIGGNPLAIDVAVDLALQITEALDAAHAKGIIHRDIKTANIFVTDRGLAKVLDFGLAKLVSEQIQEPVPDDPTQTALDMTSPGSVVGTVSYMSPEQALGKDLDHRTDIFSLGVVLYEMITARRAFEGNTSAALFDAILNKAPTAPVEFNSNVSPELERIVNKTLEKEAGLRYQSAAELGADLKRLRFDSSSDPGPRTSPRRGGPKPVRIIGGLATLLAVVITAIVFWPSADRDTTSTMPAVEVSPSKGPSIAVLPFVNSSGDPDQKYFSDGLTEDIITELSKYKDLFVIARHSTSQYEGDYDDVRQVGAAFGGVRYVLQGSVRKSGDRIRVTAKLSSTDDGGQLWRNSYTRNLTVTDLFSLQDELTQQVVTAIAGSYGALSRAEMAETRRKPPTSLDSHDCVLRMYEYVQIHIAANHLAARDCLEEAVKNDPEYADAWGWLAYAYSEEHRHSWNARPESYDSLERALEVAEIAIKLDPANQVAHGALALTHFQLKEYDRFRAEADRAVALNPNNALWLAYFGLRFCDLESWDRGLPLVRKALALNPNPPPWLHNPFFFYHYRHGRYEAALTEVQKIKTEDFRTPMFRAATYGQLGRLEEAERELSAVKQMWPGFPEGLRREMIDQYGYPPARFDHLLEGLRKAGMQDSFD